MGGRLGWEELGELRGDGVLCSEKIRESGPCGSSFDLGSGRTRSRDFDLHIYSSCSVSFVHLKERCWVNLANARALYMFRSNALGLRRAICTTVRHGQARRWKSDDARPVSQEEFSKAWESVWSRVAWPDHKRVGT